MNVAADSKISTAKRHKPKIKAGTNFPMPTEVRALLDAAAPKAEAMVALAALAGCEHPSFAHFDGRTSNSAPAPQSPWCAIGSPKSDSSRRTVPLGEVAVRALKAWKLAQAPGRALVFGTGADRPDMLGNLQHRLLSPLCAQAGVPRYTWHSLRHYAISSWLAAGIDLKTVQAWAGHATLAMTMDTYGHLIPRTDDHQRIAAARASATCNTVATWAPVTARKVAENPGFFMPRM